MITVICSTRVIDPNYEKMLRSTSGIKDEDLEVLMFTNNGEMSLTQIYNIGLNQAKNDIIVFAHDDIEILSKCWGKKLIDHYQKTDYGILGVAGTRTLDKTGVWWSVKESMYGNVTHTDGFKSWVSEYSFNFGNRIKDVVVVDGVFFSCKKSVIKKQFDECYDGFHFYDISFCFDNFINDVKVGVMFDISIKHKSVGDVNDKWNENRIKFINKNMAYLPLMSDLDIPYVITKNKIKNEKKLAIIIPTKNKVDELLIPCLDSILFTTKYDNYTIYVADTGSDDVELDKIRKYILDKNKIKLIEYDYYNFAKINNDVVNSKIDPSTELILFCNNDVQLINDAITLLVDTYDKNDKIGTVGCRLHYENGAIQHMGVLLSMNDKQEAKFNHCFENWDFENIRHSNTYSYTHGNTAAFMLTSKMLFDEIGGFNEVYVECFEDVEYNLNCLLKNKKNITISNAVCYHLESQTRDKKSLPEDLNRLLAFINENPIIKKTFNIIK